MNSKKGIFALGVMDVLISIMGIVLVVIVYKIFPMILVRAIALADNHFLPAFIVWVFGILPAITIFLLLPLWSLTMGKLGIGRWVRKISFTYLPGSRVQIPIVAVQKTVIEPMGWRDAITHFGKKDPDDDYANNRRWHFFIGAFAITVILGISIPRPSGLEHAAYSVQHDTIGEDNVNQWENMKYHLLHGCDPAHGCDDGSVKNYQPSKHTPLDPVAPPHGFFFLASIVLFVLFVLLYGIWVNREEVTHGWKRALQGIEDRHKAHNEEKKKGWEAQKAAYESAAKQQQQQQQSRGKGKGQQPPQIVLPPKPADNCPTFGKWSIAWIFGSEIAAEFVGGIIEHWIRRRFGSATS